ncbi:MAG: hypothetical protein BJ554DRAFT_5572 [Olpidium bornovanus]|uniref:Uncharacterized protein n=1 Tax=Olpidium bornovanus TaxID=278681 RepID=A0A8H7ZZC2_9FUNG|nr:MAG: hypothetical protein BJ554DRAFT_5572 [Olpidium bornovanus]
MMEGFRGGASLVVQYSCRGPYWPLAVNSIPKQVIPENALVYSVQGTPQAGDRSLFGIPATMRLIRARQQDPRIRSELMKSLRKRQMKKAERDEDAGRRASAEACADPRELQLQLEISQATIRSLQASVYNLTVESDLKLQAMRRELEQERSRTARMAAAMRDVLNFGKRREEEEEEEAEYASAEPRDREPGLPTAEASEGEENDIFGADREVEELANRNFDDVRKLKQMYFFSLALSIKMNSLCFDRRPPFAPNGEGATNIQELYELYENGPDVPIERWPKFISERLQL